MKHINCSSRIDPTLKILQFKCNAIPSMKIKIANVTQYADVNDNLDECYTVCLAFYLKKININISAFCMQIL